MFSGGKQHDVPVNGAIMFLPHIIAPCFQHNCHTSCNCHVRHHSATNVSISRYVISQTHGCNTSLCPQWLLHFSATCGSQAALAQDLCYCKPVTIAYGFAMLITGLQCHTVVTTTLPSSALIVPPACSVAKRWQYILNLKI